MRDDEFRAHYANLRAQFAELRAQLEAQIEILRAVRHRRRHLDDLDDEGLMGVREPGHRDDPPLRTDTIAAPLPTPRYQLDVIGRPGGKVTIETKS